MKDKKLKKINKIISYTTNQMGTTLTESSLDAYFAGNGDAKPIVWLTKKQLETIKGKYDVDVPRAKFICSFSERLRRLEEMDLDPDITGGK